MGNLIIAFLDQVFVSGGNFITLALGAHLLSLDDQGKFCYVISLYTITTLINVALIFSVAPIIKKSLHSISHVFYRQQLLLLQLLVAASISLLLCIFLYEFRYFIQWDFNILELLFIYIFLLVQQMVDFFRRSGYIFEGVKNAFITSLFLYTVRILIIILIHPSTLLEMLSFLALSCFAGLLPIFLIYRKKFFKIYRKGLHKPSLIEHFSLSKWNVISAPLGWVNFFLPAFLLGGIESPGSVAIYLSIRSLSGSANIFLELLETFVPKWLCDFNKKKHLLKATIKLLLIGLGVWVGVLFLIFIFGRNLILNLFGSEYISFSKILVFFWLGNGIHFITRVFGLYFRINKNTFFDFIGSIGGFLALIMSLPMIFDKGLNGAVLSTIIIPTGIMIAQAIFYFYKPDIIKK